jgi:Concanavalin A-like lectin/glucanases superfamily
MLLLSALGAIGSAGATVMDSYGAVIHGIPGRVSWWRLGETSGTAAIDHEGTHNGVYQSGVTLNQASLPANTDDPDIALDGINGHVAVTHNAAHSISSGSIAIWFRPTSLAADFGLVSKDVLGITAGDMSVWYRQTSNDLRFHIQDGSIQHLIAVVGALAINTTYCAVATWGASGMKLYLGSGGSVALRGTHTHMGGTTGNTNALLLGATGFTGATANFFPGRLGDVIMWNRQLTNTEIEAVTQGTLSEQGTYEPVVTGLGPAIYLKFNEASGATFSDSSGNTRSGTLTGTASAYNVTTLPSGTAGSNGGLNLGGAASVSIAHASADTALTFPSSQPWTGGRKVADCTVSIWFKLNSLPTGGNKAVVTAKSSSQTPGVAASYDGSWEAYVDSSGALHVECRSFRGRPCRIRTPNSAVAAGATKHLVVQLSYDGVAAWLNGAKLEDGYANLLHVFGLAADIRGTIIQNNFAWTIGKAAWGGQANIQVDEFALYLSTLTTADAESLAQAAGVAPLEHHIWGQRYVNASGFASIQAAVDNVNGLGGGTVLVDPGTYTENITLKSNVRIKANGGIVTINGWARTSDPGAASLGAGTGDFLTGDRTLNISNSRSVGDLVRVLATGGNPSPMRHDRRWNSASETNDPNARDGQTFEIESRTATTMTFVGSGSIYDFAAADRETVQAFTPVSWVALEGDLRFVQTNTIEIEWVKHARLVGIRATNTSTTDNFALFVAANSMFVQGRDLTVIQGTLGSGTQENDGIACWNGPTDCAFKDCDVSEGRHGCDASGHANWGITIRCEWHNIDWDNTNSRGAPGAKAAFGVHGPSTDCIYWNCTSNWGGTAVTGWKHDARWHVCGDAAVASSGAIGMNDGAKECWYRDIHIIRPRGWFTAGEGVVSIDNCHFQNITRSAAPTGDVHADEGTGNPLAYGTGALVNTYSNVDGPHASWTEV